MSFTVTTEMLMLTMRRLHPHWLGSYHLAPCGGCLAPVHQQPCPLCNYYPMGAEGTRQEKPKADRERYIRWLEGRGGPLEAVIQQQARCLDPLTEDAEWLRRKTAGWTWPAASQLWEVFGPEANAEELERLHGWRACIREQSPLQAEAYWTYKLREAQWNELYARLKLRYRDAVPLYEKSWGSRSSRPLPNSSSHWEYADREASRLRELVDRKGYGHITVSVTVEDMPDHLQRYALPGESK